MSEDRSKKSEDDPLDNLLNLEEQYHREGYNLGVTDGSRAGRIEGRIFGLEKGFEKFVEMGQLGGRATVWNAEQLSFTTEGQSSSQNARRERLGKHISRLTELTSIETLSTENGEEAVADFDDRVKDARVKVMLISKMVGEGDVTASGTEIPSTMHLKQSVQVKRDDAGKTSAEMEDFTGLPRGKRAQ